MDPIGFALESFDGVGKWRTRDGQQPVDASGVFVDGVKLNGVSSLREALLQYSDQFVQNFTEKLLIYALGRELDYRDMPAVRALVRQASRNEYRFSSIVMAIVNSDLFQSNTDPPGLRPRRDLHAHNDNGARRHRRPDPGVDDRTRHTDSRDRTEVRRRR
jgi:hypothetical protein